MKYGLIGKKLSHSFSKEIHESLADYTYELCEIEETHLAPFFDKREFCGINVTIPYKKAVIPFLDLVSESAKELDAVNVIVNRDGKLCGYNTDYMGLMEMISRSGASLEGKKVLILGTGGAARTAQLVARDLGALKALLVSRSKSRGDLTYDEAYALHTDAEVIINATPVGMYPDNYSSPIDISRFESLVAVFDVVYNPLRTPLVLAAKERGIVAEGGLYMLVSQATHAVELFLDAELPNNKTEELFRNISRSKENIILVGMPSSGKTTVGESLSKKLTRPLIDLDDEIEDHLGCTIAEFFTNHSEKEFRDVEAMITERVSKLTGAIIATGGGCILRESNVCALRSNGKLCFLDRDPLSLTPTYSRPLARKSSDIENLYKVRYPIYLSVSDLHVDANRAPEAIADQIIKELYS